MNKMQVFELRVGDSPRAILRVSEAGTVLEHDLSDVQLAVCPGFAVFDDKGHDMTIAQGVGFLAVSDCYGAIRLKLSTSDANDESMSDIVNVVDPKRKARLVWMSGRSR